jgi:hypothetical protein
LKKAGTRNQSQLKKWVEKSLKDTQGGVTGEDETLVIFIAAKTKKNIANIQPRPLTYRLANSISEIKLLS